MTRNVVNSGQKCEDSDLVAASEGGTMSPFETVAKYRIIYKC